MENKQKLYKQLLGHDLPVSFSPRINMVIYKMTTIDD